MPTLYISEEYGYREYIAELTDAEWEELKRKWQTLKGLNCLVPVKFIIPQVIELAWDRTTNELDSADYTCHIHESDDSYLDTVEYEIPEDYEFFWFDGKKYLRWECDLLRGPDSFE